MRHLLPIIAVTLVALGCGERTAPKDPVPNVKPQDLLPILPGNADKKPEPKVAMRSVAVLPFKVPVSGVMADSLADTLNATITSSLSQNPELSVSAQAAVRQWRNYDALEAGKALKARAVLTGEVKHQEDDLIVTLELIEIENSRQLWGKVFRDTVKNDKRKEFEDKIAKEVADAVTEKLGAKPVKKDK